MSKFTEQYILARKNPLNILAGGGNINAALGKAGAIAGAAGTILNAGLSNALNKDTSELESSIASLNNATVTATSNTDLLNLWSLRLDLNSVSWKSLRPSVGSLIGNTIGAVGSGAATGALLGGLLGAVVGAAVGLGSALAGIFTGRKKAKKKAKALNQNIATANARNLLSFKNAASNIAQSTMSKLRANYSAYGGLLSPGIPYMGNGAIGYELANDYINNQRISAKAKERSENIDSYNTINNYGTSLNQYDLGGVLRGIATGLTSAGGILTAASKATWNKKPAEITTTVELTTLPYDFANSGNLDNNFLVNDQGIVDWAAAGGASGLEWEPVTSFAKGGKFSKTQVGDTIDISPEEYDKLILLGYQLEIVE